MGQSVNSHHKYHKDFLISKFQGATVGLSGKYLIISEQQQGGAQGHKSGLSPDSCPA